MCELERVTSELERYWVDLVFLALDESHITLKRMVEAHPCLG